jgi:hypothetical protein
MDISIFYKKNMRRVFELGLISQVGKHIFAKADGYLQGYVIICTLQY